MERASIAAYPVPRCATAMASVARAIEGGCAEEAGKTLGTENVAKDGECGYGEAADDEANNGVDHVAALRAFLRLVGSGDALTVS